MALQPLLSAATLASDLDGYRILEAGARAVAAGTAEDLAQQSYRQGHLPGALFADLWAAFSDPASPWPYQRPGAERFTHAAQAVGVRAGQRVVVYDRANGIWAARLWWLFQAYGHTAVQVLDGGLDAWCAAGLPLEQGEESAAPGDWVTSAERPGYFVGRDEVLAVVNGQRPGQLLNVLRRPVFTGEELRYTRRGHIPGSQHMPHGALIDPGSHQLLPVAALQARFAALNPGTPIITYCGSGITAAGTALALAVAGWHNVAVYDGSMAEWTADPGLPLTTLGG
ncbi:sulfurtransferase [Pseudomonas typographi]|uniref:Sulfurtransferase n=1 Tax=Pseudomonas typographi TaxID=2715964 RepID=A0ABR7YWT3_9PSED|nr:rhodanese-like domain-containing protein [Pseudomonas typographi]MBD1552594.1 sulfurtransferase [Pseudomonas typographi]MBD1586175.1 sulfurtransferase [Pseudomonas typographi]MBD1597646.1 sulfurtransferase [Pseudomonas typographi]